MNKNNLSVRMFVKSLNDKTGWYNLYINKSKNFDYYKAVAFIHGKQFHIGITSWLLKQPRPMIFLQNTLVPISSILKMKNNICLLKKEMELENIYAEHNAMTEEDRIFLCKHFEKQNGLPTNSMLGDKFGHILADMRNVTVEK